MSKSVFSYYLGLGSNIGNRCLNLTKCLQHIKSIGNIKQTSFLYESQPMYYKQQSSFLNAALHIESSLDPPNLLNELKNIEQNVMKRHRNFQNGPRIIDIDILCGFENSKEIYFTDKNNTFPIQIPHPRISERNFVLTPLSDIYPNYKLLTLNKTASSLSETLSNNDKSQHLIQILPLKNQLFHSIDNSDHTLKHKTLLMGILNITPDSFSDGGKWINNNDKILKYIDNELTVNNTELDIIDIGGQSTRPSSERLSAEQELDRILPVLQSINHYFSNSDGNINIPISIDTYNSKVAKECIINGSGDIINDISGGTMDDAMYDIVAELGVPYICMHLRGDPSTMQKQYNLRYGDNIKDIIDILTKELHERVNKAQQCGIAAWNIILDPGIGFAKNTKQCQYLLNNMDKLKMNKKYPILSGCSRKSYLNQILGDNITKKGDDSIEKIIGSQCAVTASILSGANIIRVHDLYTMDIVRRVSDSIYNVNQGRDLSIDNELLKTA